MMEIGVQKEIEDLDLSLRDILAELMEVDSSEISMTKNFSELGLDSLVGLRFVRRVKDVTGIEVDLEWVFDHPTLSQLASHIKNQLCEVPSEMV
jgi:acyl carrier protein